MDIWYQSGKHNLKSELQTMVKSTSAIASILKTSRERLRWFVITYSESKTKTPSQTLYAVYRNWINLSWRNCKKSYHNNMLNFFSNKPYILNFYLQLPVGTISEIYEMNKDFLGEDQYKEDLIMASIHNS